MGATSWLEIDVRVPRERAELVASLLEGQGALSVTLEDQGDTPVLEPGVGETPLWPQVQVKGLFEGDTEPGPVLAALALVPGLEAPERIRIATLGERDWVRAWMDGFEPMRFGRGLWIVPEGMEAPAQAGTVLRLDPGLAFGTGTHPTTRLCLEWIDGHDLAGAEVLDYGCGSGVLGIAAVLEGARRAWCVDNDPQALVATRANAERNGVADRVEALAPGALAGALAEAGTPAVDAVLANILAGPLVALAGELVGRLRPGGRIVLSGILGEQADEVAAAYAEACGVMGRQALEGWVRLEGRRRAAA